MHDTILLHNISEQVNQLCISNHIKTINKLILTVNHNSHVNKDNLYEHLKLNSNYIGSATEIEIKKSDIQEQTAILECLEGEKEDKVIKF